MLIVVAGVICLSDPFGTLIVLAYLIGIGWIAGGNTDIMAAIHGSVRPRWFGWVAGLVSILAGIVVFVLPAAGLQTFVLIGSILLLGVSISALRNTLRTPKVKPEVTPIITKVDWDAIMKHESGAGTLKQTLPYEQMVDTSFAEKATKEFGLAS